MREVAGHAWGQISVDYGCRCTLVFAELGQYTVRGGNGQTERAQGCFETLLGCWIGEGEEKRDGDGFCAAGAYLFDQRMQLFFRGLAQDAAFGADALGNSEAKFARDNADGYWREP